jgi:predicted NBD/HSP70 family sugar kinase
VADYLDRRRGIAADELRRHNLSTVLDRIHLERSVSRAELTARTGLNRSTIRDLLVELIDLGLVVEDSVTSKASPGRPSSVARARPSGAVALAIELEVDYTAAATVGLGGHIFSRVRADNPHHESAPETIVSMLADLTGPLLATLPPDSALIGVGAAAAGLVRRADGFLVVSPNRGWHDAPLAEMIGEALGVSNAVVANEADASVLAESRRGAARDHRNVIFVTGEVGLGLGVVVDGTPMLGTAGYAGEAGHTVINPGGRACRCGSTGCWETEVGEEAFARHAGVRWEGRRHELIDELLRRAHAGDPVVFDAFREVGRWLGLGVGNLVNIFNPDLIVFGGFYYPLFPFLQQPIADAAASVALAAPWASCEIAPSALGLDARLIGAAELVFTGLIADPAQVARRRRSS